MRELYPCYIRARIHLGAERLISTLSPARLFSLIGAVSLAAFPVDMGFCFWGTRCLPAISAVVFLLQRRFVQYAIFYRELRVGPMGDLVKFFVRVFKNPWWWQLYPTARFLSVAHGLHSKSSILIVPI